MTVIQFPETDTRSLNERVTEEVGALMGRYAVTQVVLAAWLDLSQPQVSARIRNRQPWRIEEIERIAFGFGRHPAELMGGYPADGPTSPGNGPIPIKAGTGTTGGYVDHFARRRIAVARSTRTAA